MASVRRFFLFRARNPESLVKLCGFSNSYKKKNSQLAFKNCLLSSLHKNTKLTSLSKYSSLYHTNGASATTCTLLNSHKYQEENRVPPFPFRWLMCSTTAVVFSLFYTLNNTAYTAGKDGQQITEFRLNRKRKIAEKMKNMRQSLPTENEPPGKRLCENLEDIPVSKWCYIRQESGKVKLKNP